MKLGEHVVEVAHDGPEALHKAREFRPEVVLCDIGLPSMSGYDVARAFREDESLRGSFLVALTGYALPEDQRKALEAGFDYHIAKPTTSDKLDRLFTQVLQGR